MSIEREKSYIFSSSPVNGATNITNNGSVFSVQLNNPITIPKEALYSSLEVQSANIWWTVPNISISANNNKFYLHCEYVPTDRILPGEYPDYTITIDNGLYGREELNSALSREFVNLGLPGNVITFTDDPSTQRVVFTVNIADPTWIDFTQSDTFREIVGFNSRLVPTAPQLSGYHELADSVARFNTISSFLISTDLISNGIPVNSNNSGVIANVLINVQPGSLINYQPVISVKTNASELIGNSKNYFTFRLTDDQNNLVDTNGEYYSFTVILRYNMPI